jgi:hypothetical protein
MYRRDSNYKRMLVVDKKIKSNLGIKNKKRANVYRTDSN